MYLSVWTEDCLHSVREYVIISLNTFPSNMFVQVSESCNVSSSELFFPLISRVTELYNATFVTFSI